MQDGSDTPRPWEIGHKRTHRCTHIAVYSHTRTHTHTLDLCSAHIPKNVLLQIKHHMHRYIMVLGVLAYGAMIAAGQVEIPPVGPNLKAFLGHAPVGVSKLKCGSLTASFGQ